METPPMTARACAATLLSRSKLSAPLFPASSSSFPASRADDPRSSRPRPPLLPASSSFPPVFRADDPRREISPELLSAAFDMSLPTFRAEEPRTPISAEPVSAASDTAFPASRAASRTLSTADSLLRTSARKVPADRMRETTSSPAFMEFAPEALVVAVHGDDF